MCKVNGHSIFSYMFQPVTNWKKLATSKKKASSEIKQVEQPEIKMGDDTSEVATTAKLSNNNKKKNPISSLRVPLNTSNTGASTGSQTSVGLNLGGY